MSDQERQKKRRKTVTGKRQQKLVGNPEQVVSWSQKGKADQEVSKLAAEVSNINFSLL